MNQARTGKSGRTMFRQRQRRITGAAKTVAAQLEETNIISITRLMEIFGEVLVQEFADRANARYAEAQAAGAAAYQAMRGGTDIATYNGQPRTRGGVFFYLMRAHALAMGLDWFGLRIAPPRTQPAATAQAGATASPSTEPGSVQPTAAAATPSAPPLKSASLAPAPLREAAQPRQQDVPSAAKPNRLKATIIGTPLGEPRPTDQPGVLQLVFEVEMTPTMPKGLPTLGKSRVVVLCTEKQYRQASSSGAAGRMIVEGEASVTLSAAGKPLALIVCTRLTTTEAEQSKRTSAG